MTQAELHRHGRKTNNGRRELQLELKHGKEPPLLLDVCKEKMTQHDKIKSKITEREELKAKQIAWKSKLFHSRYTHKGKLDQHLIG